MIRNKKTAGPFSTGQDLHGHSDTVDLPITQDLAWYDGPIYAIAEDRGKIFLRIDDMTGPVERNTGVSYPKEMRQVVHLLEFPSVEAAKATLLKCTSPTRTSYNDAISIKREVTTWTLHAPGKADNYRIESCELDLQDFIQTSLEDELPHPKYLPPARTAAA